VDSYSHLPVDPAADRQELKLSEVVSKHSSTGEGIVGKKSPRLEGLLHTDKQLSNAANGWASMSPHEERDPIIQIMTRSTIGTCSTSGGGGEKQPNTREIIQFMLAHITAMIALRICSKMSNMLTVLRQGTQMFFFRNKR
jgi:hypothetical protein